MAGIPKDINTTYDVVGAFRAIEDELTASMIRNLDHHRAEELEAGFNWSQWQVEQLAALDAYKKRNLKKYQGIFRNINLKIDTIISMQRAAGNADQEVSILKAIKEGAKLYKAKKQVSADGRFFKNDDKKINALIKATEDDFKKAEIAILRRANDQYRHVIFNAQMYAATGASYEKAVDMATKDFLSAGINCIEYKNGARHTMSEYADMALRTAQKRAYLTGEGEKRQEWGISTVIMNKRGNPCPKCKPFVGKIFIDDVWSGGSKDGISETTGLKYPLLSGAVKKGLYHPRCRDSHTTYFEGISTPPDDKYTKEELEELAKNYDYEQRQQYAQRQAEKYGRLEEYSLDADNKRKYGLKKKVWNKIANSIDTMREHEPLLIHELGVPYKDDIISIISKSDERIQRIFLKYSDEIVIINENALGKGVTKKNGIRINLKNDKFNSRGAYTTIFHEIGHAIDHAGGGISYKTPNFKNALINDFEGIVNLYKKEYNLTEQEVYAEIGKKIGTHQSHSVSDIIGGITENKCIGKYSHEKEYWEKPNKLEKEAFAHFYEAFARNDEKKIYYLSEMFPTATREFMKLLE